MTSETLQTVNYRCDVPWCLAVSARAADEATARTLAESQSWSIGPGMHLCPAHHQVMVNEVTGNAG